MYCKKCGNEVGQNACFCEKCGALCGGNLFVHSKKSYFDSQMCSKKSGRLTVIGWVLVVCIIGLLIYNLVISMGATPEILSKLSECKSYEDVIKTTEKLTGTAVAFSEEEFAMLNMSVSEFISTVGMILYITIIVSSVMIIAVSLLSVFTVYKKSFKCAVWGAVLCALTSSSILVFGMSIALAFFANSWNKEYKAYCLNPQAFGDDNNFDFS